MHFLLSICGKFTRALLAHQISKDAATCYKQLCASPYLAQYVEKMEKKSKIPEKINPNVVKKNPYHENKHISSSRMARN
jgi:hypothetical protein